jgi:NADP-dependent 3-hydroxy acid dehydrogenase YdfG
MPTTLSLLQLIRELFYGVYKILLSFSKESVVEEISNHQVRFCCGDRLAKGTRFAVNRRRHGTMLDKAWKNFKYGQLLQMHSHISVMEDLYYRKRNVIKELPSKYGQVAVVTGGARGIGLEVVKMLVQCGMKVVIGVRNVQAGYRVAKEIELEGYTGKVIVEDLDVSSMKSVYGFAQRVSQRFHAIHLLVNNAGIMIGDYIETVDGFDSQFATNYLGHFYLTHLLMPSLKVAGRRCKQSSRIVNVSSCAHQAGEIFFDDMNMKKEYINSAAYAQSKLAQVFKLINYQKYSNRNQL